MDAPLTVFSHRVPIPCLAWRAPIYEDRHDQDPLPSGHLAIRTIQGRNGAFNVGRLSTSIGEFVIKNAMLEQHVEGS